MRDGMRPVFLRLRAELRSRSLSWLTLALIIAIVAGALHRRRRRGAPDRHRVRAPGRQPARGRRRDRQHAQPRDPDRRPRPGQPPSAGDRVRAVQVLRHPRQLGERVRGPRRARLWNPGPEPAEDPARPDVEPRTHGRGRRRLRARRPSPSPRGRHLHDDLRESARGLEWQPRRRLGARDPGQAHVQDRRHRRRARPVPTAGLPRLPRRPAVLPDARVLPDPRARVHRARRRAPPHQARSRWPRSNTRRGRPTPRVSSPSRTSRRRPRSSSGRSTSRPSHCGSRPPRSPSSARSSSRSC